MATYVLVHGAYQGGWIWKPVAQRLRAARHEVYALTLEGCGERHDTPHPIAALEAPMGPTNFWEQTWKAAVIRCRQARNRPEAHQRRTAERLKASYTEIDTGHYPMLSQPAELARLLMSA